MVKRAASTRSGAQPGRVEARPPGVQYLCVHRYVSSRTSQIRAKEERVGCETLVYRERHSVYDERRERRLTSVFTHRNRDVRGDRDRVGHVRRVRPTYRRLLRAGI